MDCKLVIKDEVNVAIQGLEPSTRRTLVNKYKFDVPGARYSPAVRLGRWDGKVSFVQASGTTYINLLPDILEILDKEGYNIEVDDLRTYRTKFEMQPVTESTFAHKNWPKGHPQAGKPVLLRDYQIAAVNNFLADQQGLQEISTGAGKCLTGDTMLQFTLSDDSPMRDYAALYRKDGSYIMPFAALARYIDCYYKPLRDNKEVNVMNLGIAVPTPTGTAKVLHFIKKENLAIRKVTLCSGYEFKAAVKHIVQVNGNDIFVEDLKIGDCIGAKSGVGSTVTAITFERDEDCYDISIPAPHLYYDAHGVAHHNTIMTAALSCCVEPYGRSLVIVPNKSLVVQTLADYENLGLDVGVYFGDRKDVGSQHTICTWQSLHNMMKNTRSGEAEVTIHEFIKGVVCVIVDEVQSAKSSALKDLLTGPLAKIPIRWGLTGTIPKEPMDQISLLCSLGPVVGQLSAKELQNQGVLSNCHVNIMQIQDKSEYLNYQAELKYLLTDSKRLDKLATMIKEISATGNTMVLIDRVEAGHGLISKLPDAVFVHGNTKSTERTAQYKSIDTTEAGTVDDKILVCTYGVASTGISITKLHNVVLIEPGKSFVRTIQSIGRGLRKGFDKDHVEIWDITSSCKFAKRHLTARKKFYDDAQYAYTVKKIPL